MVESDSRIITPRTWEDELGDWMRDFFNSHSEIVPAQNLKPLAEGIVLWNPVIGLTSDVFTLSTDHDIYWNKVSTFDMGLAIIDLMSFGIAKISGTRRFIRKVGQNAKQVESIFNSVNTITTGIGSLYTIIRGYVEEN